jgi:hypothetical protein
MGESLGAAVGVAEAAGATVAEACATPAGDGLGERLPENRSAPKPSTSTATRASAPTASAMPMTRSAEGRCIGQS